MSIIADNLERLYRRINAAAERARRHPQDVTLVAVTKTHSLETVIEAYQAGLRDFGENRVAEGNEKLAAFGSRLEQAAPGDPARWHFIGHIQSRKAGSVLTGGYDLVHSVDSQKLAERMSRLVERDQLAPADILLQCNVSGEKAKSGFTLASWQDDPGQLGRFKQALAEIEALPGVNVRGLMTMAPIVEDPEETRPIFRSLFELFVRLKEELPDVSWQHLSMGMTDDFEVAIEEGATMVRVGRAIFGERELD
jgi:pyridoxal phosphate enzyme (YggS family)